MGGGVTLAFQFDMLPQLVNYDMLLPMDRYVLKPSDLHTNGTDK